MVYLALQGMALASPNFSSTSLSTTATHSNFTSLTSTPASSTTSLPLSSSPSPKPTHSYPETTGAYINSIKLETIEPPTYGSSHVPSIIPDHITKKVPRPPNSFIIYRREHSSNYSKITAAELSKILGEQWANEPPERKAYYAKLAKAAEKEHALKYPEYKFTPAKRGTGRRAKTIRAAVSAALKVAPTTTESPKARAYKPSPLSALAPNPLSPSSSPRLASPRMTMPSVHSSQGYVTLKSGMFPYNTSKSNTHSLAHLARPGDVEDFHLRLHHRSSRSGAQRPKSRLVSGPLRPRPGTPSTPTSPYCQATAPGSFDLGSHPSLNFGFPNLLTQSPGVTGSPPLSSPGMGTSSLLFDSVVPTNWQWTPPVPAAPGTPTFAMPLVSPSTLQSQPQSPMPLGQDLAHHHTNIPVLDYFTLQDSGRPAPFAMSWGPMNPMSPMTPETPLPYSGVTTTAAVTSSDIAPTSYQWGVGVATPVSPWPSHDVVYSTGDLPTTPVSPEFCAPMSIPIPSAKQNHLHNYHQNQMVSPLNQSTVGFVTSMADQDMSISPVLSSCSSSYGSMYSLNERPAHLPPSYLSGDLVVDSAATTAAATTTITATVGEHLSVPDLEQQMNNAKLAVAAAAVSQFVSPSPVACKSFL
ncbi:Casanova [Linnemannia exigua]|uniref:Casanova n=1 Tax=Linnemannia exigua TaxID=604196 RepID=A0AAD4D143_9FUNG|nr:Casanova [Linnemannia exigua]